MHTRGLTDEERAALSPGLVRALDDAGAQPWICDAPHAFARLSSLWRGHVPILTLGDTIHWPGAPACFSAEPANMAILQHELHHALEYATGVLTPLRYVLNPLNWFYDFKLSAGCKWSDLGAEQRAMAAERLWQAERGLPDAGPLDELRALVPWAGLELEGHDVTLKSDEA
jgi:hypothetical protein